MLKNGYFKISPSEKNHQIKQFLFTFVLKTEEKDFRILFIFSQKIYNGICNIVPISSKKKKKKEGPEIF